MSSKAAPPPGKATKKKALGARKASGIRAGAFASFQASFSASRR